MAIESGFYEDSGLTVQAGAVNISQLEDGTSVPAYPSPADQVIYFGLANAAKKVQALSSPGVDHILVSIVTNVGSWAASTAVLLNDLMQPDPPNGYKYQALGNGTTGASPPTLPTVIGQTVIDNDFTWECVDEIHLASEVRLATSKAGLDTATPGANLDIGTTVTGGTAVPVWMRTASGVHPAGGPYADLRLETVDLVETTV